MIKNLFKIYQEVISPITHILGKSIFGTQFSCRYSPTCSEYTKTAISKYGIFHGSLMGVKRLLRCHPFSAGGYDPVPDKI